MYGVGRPQHFIDILSGKTIIPFDFMIITCHGEPNGEIIMPELSEEIYFPDEPRGNFGFFEINKYLALKDTCIIGFGCYLGNENMAKAFVNNNNNIYIAPKDAIDGDSGLVFIILLFYYLSSQKYEFDIKIAYKKASSLDDETKLFILK